MDYSISIVSHRSGSILRPLLADLRRFLPPDSEILLTINVPENEGFLDDFSDLPLTVLRNEIARGFGENHNRAFAASRGSRFVVVNPDIRLLESPFEVLASGIAGRVGACAPVVLSPSGGIEDSVRRFPTISRLLRRVLLRQRAPDYAASPHKAISIDWSAGMFVMFSREAFKAVRGFDENYFMYMEDAAICRELRRLGWDILWVTEVRVVHDAQRASHRDFQHLRWHARSAVRFLFGV